MRSWRQAQGTSPVPIPDEVWIFWLRTVSNVSVLPLNVNSGDKNTVAPQFILTHNTFRGLGEGVVSPSASGVTRVVRMVRMKMRITVDQ